MPIVLDLNCNCSYCAVDPIRVDNIMLFKTWCNKNITQSNLFSNTKSCRAISSYCAYFVHYCFVDVFIYIYICGFFSFRKSLSSLCTLIHFSFVFDLNAELCCTYLHFLSLQIQKSSPWFNMHIFIIVRINCKTWHNKFVHIKMCSWWRSIQNPWLKMHSKFLFEPISTWSVHTALCLLVLPLFSLFLIIIIF